MTSANWALQKAIFTTLSGAAPLTALIGADRIYDDVPGDAEFPYVTFGQSQLRDWSTGSDGGHEHVFTLNVWSRENGRREVTEAMGLLEAALHDAELTLDGHRLINLRHEFSESRREADGETYRGIIRYRAVTEPAP
ncbi:MAG: hypothetical protein APF80_13215 [Alphaproteobacteria bacterium BRH_c36]|nr:MAG: hypothetical protein APF80_13215 [Alphaproteobacteria bacterium BRH_c36]